MRWYYVHNHGAAKRACGAARLVHALRVGRPYSLRGTVHKDWEGSGEDRGLALESPCLRTTPRDIKPGRASWGVQVGIYEPYLA